MHSLSKRSATILAQTSDCALDKVGTTSWEAVGARMMPVLRLVMRVISSNSGRWVLGRTVTMLLITMGGGSPFVKIIVRSRLVRFGIKKAWTPRGYGSSSDHSAADSVERTRSTRRSPGWSRP